VIKRELAEQDAINFVNAMCDRLGTKIDKDVATHLANFVALAKFQGFDSGEVIRMTQEALDAWHEVMESKEHQR
jgi:hypothetical protein